MMRILISRAPAQSSSPQKKAGNRMRLAFLVLSLLLSAGCLRNRGPETGDLAGKMPVGFLDAPKSGEVVRGKTTVRGWALSESGIRQVAIYVDGVFAGNAKLQVTRPDLAHFPFRNPDKGGFEWEWDSTTVSPGTHQIVAEARGNDAGVHELGSASVTTAP